MVLSCDVNLYDTILNQFQTEMENI